MLILVPLHRTLIIYTIKGGRKMDFWSNRWKRIMKRNWGLESPLGKAGCYALWLVGQIVVLVVCRIGISELLSVAMYSERYMIPVSDRFSVLYGLAILSLIIQSNISDSWRVKKAIWQQRLRRARIMMIVLVVMTLLATTWGNCALPEVLGLEIGVAVFLVIWPQMFVTWTQWFWPRVLGVRFCVAYETERFS